LGGKGGLDYGITQGIHRGHQMTKEETEKEIQRLLRLSTLVPRKKAGPFLMKAAKLMKILAA